MVVTELWIMSQRIFVMIRDIKLFSVFDHLFVKLCSVCNFYSLIISTMWVFWQPVIFPLSKICLKWLLDFACTSFN
jgi:hypothetical protein